MAGCSGLASAQMQHPDYANLADTSAMHRMTGELVPEDDRDHILAQMV